MTRQEMHFFTCIAEVPMADVIKYKLLDEPEKWEFYEKGNIASIRRKNDKSQKD